MDGFQQWYFLAQWWSTTSQFIIEECFKGVIDFKFKHIEADVAVEELSLEGCNALWYAAADMYLKVMKKNQEIMWSH